MRREALALALVVACGKPAPPAPARTVDDVIAPYAAITIGASLEAAQGVFPRLEASGWREGARATFLEPQVEAGLEVETDDGKVRAVALIFGEGRADGVERELRARLGPGVECSTLPEGISSFRPMLWRTPEGGTVSMVRKGRLLHLRVERPATPAFDAAWSSCKP
jgi:hypothetical protein